MKLFFFYYIFKEDSVYSKIDDQSKTFSQYYYEKLLKEYNSIKIVKEKKHFTLFNIFNEKVYFFKNLFLLGKIYNYLIGIPKMQKKVVKMLRSKEYTHIYIRRGYTDYNFLNFLKSLKKINIKIIYEIPTYPYDGEMNKKSLIYKLDKKYRGYLKMYVDRIVTFSNDNIIFGINTLKTINGIFLNNSIDEFKQKLEKKVDSNEINMIAVAGMHEWHGYDRLIRGMHHYYKKKDCKPKRIIRLHLVGGNEEKKNPNVKLYKDLVNKYGLNDKVIFYGKKFGTELEEIYARCAVAISSLGLYRIGLETVSSIKTKEYALKGFPIVSGNDIEFFPTNYKYFLKVENNNDDIDVEKIIKFYDSIYTSEDRKQVYEKIHNVAVENCDMYKTMMPILNYIKQGS